MLSVLTSEHRPWGEDKLASRGVTEVWVFLCIHELIRSWELLSAGLGPGSESALRLERKRTCLDREVNRKTLQDGVALGENVGLHMTSR